MNNPVENEDQALAATTPATLLAMAVEQGADIEKLEKLMALQERWEAGEAKKAYVVAMNAFKANPPAIIKDRHVSFETSKGVTEYDHATLANVTSSICAALAEHGLSHRWDVEHLDGGQIRVTCVITHVLGHSESVPMQAGRDESGGKNNIQALGSTVSYLQRYSLLAATGLATYDMDNDGASPPAADLITENQTANIRALLEETGSDKTLFLKWVKCQTIEEIKAKKYDAIIKHLEGKRQ
jgi:hypothetical protein